MDRNGKLHLIGMKFGMHVNRDGAKTQKSINKFFFETPSKHLFKREILCPQYFYYIFTTNSKWQVIIDCYE